MNLKKALIRTMIFGVVILSSPWTVASVLIEGTRVIFREDMDFVDVKVTNTGERPALVQAWLDNGDRDKGIAIDQIVVPFSISNPVFKINQGGVQIIRIFKTRPEMIKKTDVESVYWLNILEIPAVTKKETTDNYLQIALRNRIKFFYRPSKLNSSNFDFTSDVSVVLNRSSGSISIDNKSDFFVSISRIETKKSKKAKYGAVLSDGGVMIEPRGSISIGLNGQAVNGEELYMSFVNDYGSIIKKSVPVKRL
ncbi:MAG: fimbrial biogenesis chaperone [Aeromonas veronii]